MFVPNLICLVGVMLQMTTMAQSWQTGPGYRFQKLTVPAAGRPGFSLLPPTRTGLWFTNALPESRCLTNQILPSGSGVAAGDVDGDGECDLFFAGLGGGSQLYRNLGNWRFENITERAGVRCPNLDATGTVLADLDGDGDLDLIVNSIGGGTHLFFNDGKGRFTASPRVLNLDHGGTSSAVADADGDGDLDLYVANYRVSTLMDTPGTRFSVRMIDGQPVVASINGRPLTDPEWTNRFRFTFELGEGGRGKFAYEELGQPDLFCLNDGQGRFTAQSWTGGAFLDQEGRALTAPPLDWGLSVMFRDFNGDGQPDLYLCNDFRSPDRFWLNTGQGRFQAAPNLALRQICLSAMAIDVADLNRDGYDDFIVVEMLSRDHRRRLTQRNVVPGEATSVTAITGRPQYSRNTLFLNRGDDTYAEIAQYAGLEASEWSWAPLFLDVDLDGFEDLLVANGFERDNMNMDAQNRINQTKSASRVRSREDLLLRRMFPRLATENLAFRNTGHLRFEPVSAEWGFNTATISQGSCLADLDRDGDLDVIVNNMNAAAGLYRNEGSAPRLAVRLKGLPPNTRGIGAKILVWGGATAMQSQQIVAGGRYASSDDAIRAFAAGTRTNLMRIEVQWRSGKRSTVERAEADTLYEVDEAGATEVQSPKSPIPNPQSPITSPQSPPHFNDVSPLLGHTHVDEPFDDFARQSLLPRRLSQLGPGVAWIDLDNDGWDDLIVASGKGGQWTAFRNDPGRGFTRLVEMPFNQPVARDQTAVFGLTDGHGRVLLLAGSANYEETQTAGGSVQQWDLATRQGADLLAGASASSGPLALADVDADGDLDLFVGGRVTAGRYPEAASSVLLRNERGQWQSDAENSRVLRDLGLVSGAVFSDLDGDGFPDLILACDWGPIRIFHNERGSLKPWSWPVTVAASSPPLDPSSSSARPPSAWRAGSPSSLAQLTGWWNGVTTGDFDGDGRMDIAASNWGQNTKHESFRARPLRLYYGDLDGDGSVDLFEAHFDAGLQRFVPERMLDRLTRALPFLAERFATHEAYAQASIEEVLGERLDRARSLEAAWLESTVFLNRGNHFEVGILPWEAQLAPAFGLCVADYDGDGREDIFLSQNFFNTDLDTSRYDAGRGLWLQGLGNGQFRAVPGQESGVKIYGEQRGAALCDYDADGRVDLLVGQNSAETRLFRNVGGQPGLRIRLQGPGENVRGIGAVLRIEAADRPGPAREIHAGSGYWSQDSAVQVMAKPRSPAKLLVRWPGGQTTSSEIPLEAREITVGPDGRTKLNPTQPTPR